MEILDFFELARLAIESRKVVKTIVVRVVLESWILNCNSLFIKVCIRVDQVIVENCKYRNSRVVSN